MERASLLFMVADQSKKLDFYDKVMKELKDNHVEVYELACVEPNPRHTTVNKGSKAL